MQQIESILNTKTNFTVVAITAATAAVIVFGGMASATPSTTNQQGNSNAAVMSNQAQKETQAAKDLRVDLTTLLQEHVTTNLEVNREIASGATQAEINVAIEAQVANSNALSAAVGSIYGPQAEA